MKKILWLSIICLTFSVMCFCTAPTYVVITYNVNNPAGGYYASLKSSAQITYDAYHNPVHGVYPVDGVYDSATGKTTWTLPAGDYVKFICQTTNLSETVIIPGTAADLNDLVAVVAPPSPTWAQLLVPYTGATTGVNLAGYYFTTTGIGTFGSARVNGAITMDARIERPVKFYGSNEKDYFQIQSSICDPLDTTDVMNFMAPDGHGGYSSILQYTNAKAGSDVPFYYAPTGLCDDTKDIYVYWNRYNDGAASGLDADQLDGQHGSYYLSTVGTAADSAKLNGQSASYYEKALTFSLPLLRTVDTISIPKATGSVDGYLASTDWTTFNGKLSAEVDGFVGNEVTDTANTTLTRSGTGTTGNPYKLAVNEAYAHTWTGTTSFSGRTGFGNLPTGPHTNTLVMIGESGGEQVDLNISTSITGYGLYMRPQLQMGAATTMLAGIRTGLTCMSDATPRTVTNAISCYVNPISKDATSTVTNAYGIYVEPQTVGSTSNTGIYNGGTLNQQGVSTYAGERPIVLDGATADANKLTFVITDPTAAREVTFPNATGMVAYLQGTNTWTGNQTAPYFISSTQYNASAPRPAGWPQSAASAFDLEFDAGTGSSTLTWTNIAGTTTDSLATYKGYLTISAAGGVGEAWGVSPIYSTGWDNGIDVVIDMGQVINGARLGLGIADADGKNGFYIFNVSTGSQHGVYANVTGWGNSVWPSPPLGGVTALTDYEHYRYLRIMRATGSTNLITACSQDGMSWTPMTTSGGISTTFKYFAVYCKLPVGTVPENLMQVVNFVRVK